MELQGWDWPPGSVIYTGRDKPNLRAVKVTEPKSPESFVVLVVEEM